MTRNIDELNNLKTRAVEPEKYFAEMDLPEEEKERRVEYTKKANEIFDLILVLLLLSDDRSLIYESLRERLETYLLELISEYTTPDDYLIDYASDTAYNFIDTTKKHEEDPWYLSSDRALFNAENSANDVLNYDNYTKAIEEGKTHKRWITEKDNKVRESHKNVTKKPIPIKQLFYVGGVPMRFPKDIEYAFDAPQEIVNCRCSIEYLPKNKHEKSDSKTMDYRHNVDANASIKTMTKGEIISANPIIGSPNNIYLSSLLKIKPKKIQEIENNLTEFKKLLGVKGKKEPNVVLVADTQLGKAEGRYNAETNTIFYKVFNDKEEQRIVNLHELIHWDDTQKYISKGNIVKSNQALINSEKASFKKKLDKIGINADNVNTLKGLVPEEKGIYATQMFREERYDEVYTEYKTFSILRNLK